MLEVACDEPAEHQRMRNIDDAQPLQSIGMLVSQHPGNSGAPVMAHQVDLLVLECIDQAKNILSQLVETVILDPFGLSLRL